MSVSIPSTCAAVNNALIKESGRFSPGIFARAARIRPIIRLQSKTRGTWPKGMGSSLSAITFERSLPDTYAGVWANIGTSDGADANSCLPPTDTVAFGQTARPYQPQHMAIDTDYFCIRDIEQDFQYADLLAKLTQAFSNVSEWVWGSRYTSEYVRLAGHHLTLRATGQIQDDPTGYNTSSIPTSKLTQGVMNDIYMSLYREGGDLPSGLDESTNEPVFTAITSAETLKGILVDNPDIRQDNRYAWTGSKDNPLTPLLPGMPTKRRNYGGFMYEIDPYPRKFTFANGAYTEIVPFVKSATTKGYKQEVNPAYKAAPFVETIIWHENNYQSQVDPTLANPAAGWNFTPHNWMGMFEPRNILHKQCNPDGTMIYFRALFADASKPQNPAVGYSILHLDCPNQLGTRDCNGYTT